MVSRANVTYEITADWSEDDGAKVSHKPLKAVVATQLLHHVGKG